MRHELVLLLAGVLFGCAPSTPVTPSSEASSATAMNEYLMSIDTNGAGSYMVVKKGEAVGLLRWKVKLKNEEQVMAKRLVIDMLGAAGDILARDDRTVHVMPGMFLEMGGYVDVPTKELAKLAEVTAYLVTKDE